MTSPPHRYSRVRPRSRRRLAGAVVVASLVAGGIGFTLLHRDEHEISASPAPAPSVSLKLDTSGWTWEGFYGSSLPYSVADGPLEVDAGRAIGFSRTPAGAFLAGVHILARVTKFMGAAIAEPTITLQVTGPDANALLARIREAGLTPGWPDLPVDAPILIRVLGYRWVSYTPDDAVYELITQVSWAGRTDGFQRTRVRVHWADDDWRVLAPRPADPADFTTKVRSLAGYTQLPTGRP